MTVWEPDYQWVKGARLGQLPTDREPTMEDIRVNRAVASIQHALKRQEFDPHRTDGMFGYYTMRAVKDFQRDRDLKADGVVGRVTMEALFLQRVRKRSEYYDVPAEYVCGLIIQESGYDPAAVGSFTAPELGVDRGWVQLNSQANPGISDRQAFFADFALDEGARRMRVRYENFIETLDREPWESDITLAWKCAIAAHNSPVLAQRWWDERVPPEVPEREGRQIEDYVSKVQTHCRHPEHLGIKPRVRRVRPGRDDT